MRYADLIKAQIIDMLAILTGEGLDTVSIEALQKELSSQNIDVDSATLIDIVTNLPIVNNVENNVVHFNRIEDPNAEVSPEQQDKKIDNLARKQVKKEIK
jgi:hypothetical protein